MSNNNIVFKNDLDQGSLEAEILRLRAENEALKNKQVSGGIKVSEKGAVSVYGLQRFPVTLYAPAWIKLLAKAQEIQDFIKANESRLSMVKPIKSDVKDMVKLA